jgi:hypothetical protein
MSAHYASSPLHRLSGDLAQPRQDIESAFVAAGARLAEGATLLNTLSKLFEALPEALQGAQVEEAASRLRAVVDRADALARICEQEKADLVRLVDVVRAASMPISDLRRAVKMMSIVSVNARVTAAGVVGDIDDFDIFTTDIATLSQSASRTIQEFAQTYWQLTDEVDRAVAQRARFEIAHADTLTHVAASLSGAIQALNYQRESAVESSAETGRVSRQIVTRIGSAVMALQVGDSTRQRLEHIEAGLGCLSNIAQGHEVLGHDIDAADRSQAYSAIAALQEAQLTDTVAAFSEDVAQAEDALNALAEDADSIMARSRDFHGGDTGQTSAIASLSAQLRAAVAVLKDFEAERAKLEAVANAVQDKVRILFDHVGAVQEIEADMRLVSLNASIRCARLGQRGASLTVIATQLRELTVETVAAAKAAMAELDQSSTLAASLGAAVGNGGAGQIGELEEQANLALDILASLDRRIAAALDSLNSDGPKVIDLLASAARSLSGQSALADAMDNVAIGIAGLAVAPLSDVMPAGLSSLLACLRRTYTMEAERLVHDRLFDGMTDLSAAEPEPATSLDAVLL